MTRRASARAFKLRAQKLKAQINEPRSEVEPCSPADALAAARHRSRDAFIISALRAPPAPPVANDSEGYVFAAAPAHALTRDLSAEINGPTGQAHLSANAAAGPLASATVIEKSKLTDATPYLTSTPPSATATTHHEASPPQDTLDPDISEDDSLRHVESSPPSSTSSDKKLILRESGMTRRAAAFASTLGAQKEISHHPPLKLVLRESGMTRRAAAFAAKLDTSGETLHHSTPISTSTSPSATATTHHEASPLQTTLDLDISEAISSPPSVKASSLKGTSPTPDVDAPKPPTIGSRDKGLALLKAAATDTAGNLPLQGQPPIYDREIVLPVSDNFVWPKFTHVHFHDHVGNLRDSHSAGTTACSVADRRTTNPPAEGCYHVYAKVEDFVACYPHPLGFVSSSVTCAPASWSAWPYWEANTLDGSILAAAEDLLWCICLGECTAAEQPPTAHMHLLGAPDLKTSAFELGGSINKTYWYWYRNIKAIEPSCRRASTMYDAIAKVPTKDPEISMLMRSPFEKVVAKNLIDLWAVDDPWKGGEGRPAAETCAEYGAWRAALHHNYSIFRSRYAPRLQPEDFAAPQRQPFITIMPFTTHEGEFMLLSPLNAACFGIRLDKTTSIIDQARSISKYIGEAEPMLAAGGSKEFPDLVFALPVNIALVVVATKDMVLEAKLNGAEAIWCSLSTASCLPCYIHASAAAMRLRELQGPLRESSLLHGTGGNARAIKRHRASHLWKTSTDIESQFEDFLREDKEVCERFARLLSDRDSGDGVLHMFAAKLKCASDLQQSIPWPAQGLPDYTDGALLLAKVPQRPPPLTTEMLVRLPPQRVPPGVWELDWSELLRRWAREIICKGINRNAQHDLENWHHMQAVTRRSEFICLGPGAAKMIPHKDGIGGFNAFDILWQRREDGKYVPLDFEAMRPEHKCIPYLKALLGNITDKELLSLIFNGINYKAGGGPNFTDPCPRQIRLSHNVMSLAERIKGVSKVISEHIKLGMVVATKIFKAGDACSVDGIGPLTNIPGYIYGTGGVDKSDDPTPEGEKRKVGNTTDPIEPVRARNKPHGEPDGDKVVNFNELTGPAKLPEDYDGPPVPWPDPEVKMSTRQIYLANAIMRHLAHLGEMKLVGIRDDVRWMFWQFWLDPSQYWLSVCFMWLMIDGELWYCACRDLVMTMGVRPSSKIACRFAEEFLEAFNKKLDLYVKTTWLPLQTQALQNALEWRRVNLGMEQARPYFNTPWTDDFKFTYCGAELGAEGTFLWRQQCSEAKLNMSSKVGGGTVVDYVGARYVLNGGFGCVVPSKRDRTLAECFAAMAGRRTLDELIATNSYLVHIADIIDLPHGSLKGVGGPVTNAQRLGSFGDCVIKVKGFRAMDIYNEMVFQMKNRAAASFMCAFVDTPQLELKGGPMRICADSDACSDVENPHICGAAGGYFWRWPIVGAWRDRHITLTESLGTVFNTIIVPPLFPDTDILLGGDSCASRAAQLGTSKAVSLLILTDHQKKSQTYLCNAHHFYFIHRPGISNNLTDLGSRDRMREMYLLAAAFGFKLTEIPVPQEAETLARNVLAEITSSEEYVLEQQHALSQREKKKQERKEYHWSTGKSKDQVAHDLRTYDHYKNKSTRKRTSVSFESPIASPPPSPPNSDSEANTRDEGTSAPINSINPPPTEEELAAGVFVRHDQSFDPANSQDPWALRSTPTKEEAQTRSSPAKRAKYVVPEPSPPVKAPRAAVNPTRAPAMTLGSTSARSPSSTLGWYVMSDGADINMHQWDLSTPHDAQYYREFADAGYEITHFGANFAAAHAKRKELLVRRSALVATAGAARPTTPPTPPKLNKS